MHLLTILSLKKDSVNLLKIWQMNTRAWTKQIFCIYIYKESCPQKPFLLFWVVPWPLLISVRMHSTKYIWENVYCIPWLMDHVWPIWSFPFVHLSVPVPVASDHIFIVHTRYVKVWLLHNRFNDGRSSPSFCEAMKAPTGLHVQYAQVVFQALCSSYLLLFGLVRYS